MAKARINAEAERYRELIQSGQAPTLAAETGVTPSPAVEQTVQTPPMEVQPSLAVEQPVQQPVQQPVDATVSGNTQPSLSVTPDPADQSTWALNAWGNPIDPTTERHFLTNKGNNAGDVTLDPNATYRVWNGKFGKGGVVYQGYGAEGLDSSYGIASQLSKNQGKKANWAVQVYDPATEQWTTVAHDAPPKPGTFGKLAASLGPVAGGALGALLAPATGGASLALALGAIGAGVGATAGNIASGKGIADSILKGGITGMSTAATGGIARGLTPALGSIGAAGVAGAGVEGAKTAVSGGSLGDIAKNAAMGGAQAAGGAYLSGKLAPETATGGGEVNNITGASDFEGKVDLSGAMNYDYGTPDLGGGFGGFSGTNTLGGGATSSGTTDQLGPNEPSGTPNETITVSHKPYVKPNYVWVPPSLGVIGAGGASAPTAAVDANGVPVEPETYTGPDGTKTPLDTIDKIIKYGRLAGLGVGFLGNLLGGKGGGSGSTRTVPKGFKSSLAPNFLGPSLDEIKTKYAPGAGVQTPRAMPQQDWYRYGTRPEQSFFTGVPQSYTPPLPGEEDQWGNRSPGYARGGKVSRSLAVRGPGTDRSDSIPAMLSDGEYVIDAPTVRKIGRGSTERGFTKLDDLRVMVHGKRPHRALKSLGER